MLSLVASAVAIVAEDMAAVPPHHMEVLPLLTISYSYYYYVCIATCYSGGYKNFVMNFVEHVMFKL